MKRNSNSNIVDILFDDYIEDYRMEFFDNNDENSLDFMFKHSYGHLEGYEPNNININQKKRKISLEF